MQSLDVMDKAIKERDETIEDLTSRLELAVETIEMERKQQRLRRQIIFPSSRPAASSQSMRDTGNSGESGGVSASPRYRPLAPLDPGKDELERILKSKEVARKAQLSLRAAMLQSAVRERALQLRVDELERELSEAKMITRLQNGEDVLDVDECLENGISLGHATSTSSL